MPFKSERRKHDKTNGNTEFLQTYPAVAVDALLEIRTAVISAVLSLDEPLSLTNTSCVPKCCYHFSALLYFSVLPCRIQIAKCFTKRSTRFRCQVCS
jgi:hypothetical protein